MNHLNGIRYKSNQKPGHYESFYQRGNHPTRPLAFWIRHTIFRPRDYPAAAIGEVWATFFNGETGEHVVTKEEYPLTDCRFEYGQLDIEVGRARLVPGRLTGTCSAEDASIQWNLNYTGSEKPMYLIPKNLYDSPFPKAKSVVNLPLALFNGKMTVNHQEINIKEWVGSHNHNWGSQHTDFYAFGQVAGFDDNPTSFLEIVSAKIRMGPVRTPMLTPIVFRHKGETHSMVSILKSVRAHGAFRYFEWDFKSQTKTHRVEGRISAAKEDFIGLHYYNPPGGVKNCLNTKLGNALVTLVDKQTGKCEKLVAKNRALFEIFTDSNDHGIDMRF